MAKAQFRHDRPATVPGAKLYPSDKPTSPRCGRWLKEKYSKEHIAGSLVPEGMADSMKALLTIVMAVLAGCAQSSDVLNGGPDSSMNSAAHKWIRVSETGPAYERFATYADPATITRSGNTVRMSSVIDFARIPGTVSDRPRVSWKDEWEYDCQEKRHRPRHFTEYSGRMGTGDKMYSHTVPVFFWILVAPGSVGENLWKIACGKE